MAAELRISDTHLRRMFKATTGQTIHAYVEEIRLERAQALLDDGRVEATAALVERLPNSQEVRPWIADARRYVAVHDALDLVETAALLEPRQLIDGEGQPVRQRSPAAPTADPEAALN